MYSRHQRIIFSILLNLLLCIVSPINAISLSLSTKTSIPKAVNGQAHQKIISSESATTSVVKPSAEKSLSHQCQFCSKSFESRNALFRHLRDEPSCSVEYSSKGSDNKISASSKLSLALRVAYISNVDIYEDEDDIATFKDSEARRIGFRIQESIERSLNDLCSDGRSVILGCTQTSVASQRHRSLTQENGISSAGDILVINVQAPSNFINDSCQQDIVNQVLEKANQFLQKDDLAKIHILSCTPLPSDMILHAEGDCTQRVYHYLLPLSWLPDGDKLESWWLQQQHERNGPKNSEPPPSDSLRRLREALKSAESATIPNRRVRRRKKGDAKSVSAQATKNNRVGAFVNKERRPFFNFADMRLRGDASPNQEPVWRVLDKARIHSFIECGAKSPHGNENSVVAILEFRGDDFIQGQVRSIVGASLAITHGWLPVDAFATALAKDIFLETPTAPRGRLYGAGARFHFHEQKLEKQDLPDSALSWNQHDETMDWFREEMLKQCSLDSTVAKEKEWLWELEKKVAPRIRQAIKIERNTHHPRTSNNDTFVSLYSSLHIRDQRLLDIYNKTLHLLQDVVASGAWPETSKARSGVIRNTGTDNNVESSSRSTGIRGRSGSFTVFNTRIPDNYLVQQSYLPVGNTKFPELAEAVFELEDALSILAAPLERAGIDGSMIEPQFQEEKDASPQRNSSLCCAINSNAQFTPHVDSGRGAGQSLSMIVGLGDYVGGELFVEGESHDIRYRPLEFDGWSSRHWTNHYSGERFSLVWFSPEE